MASPSFKLSLFSFLAIALPASLFPSLHHTSSSLFTLLPPLWHSFLSCFTPPCLFLLLNVIILVLTLTSGLLNKSSAPPASDFYSEFSALPQKHWIFQSPNKKRALSMPNGLIRETTVKDQFPDKLPEEVDEVIKEEVQLGRDDRVSSEVSSSLDFVAAGTGMYRSNKCNAGGETISEEFRAIQRSHSVESAAVMLISEAGGDCMRQSSPAGKIVFEVLPQDDLSGEALKKKIDKFISEIYAQMRREDF